MKTNATESRNPCRGFTLIEIVVSLAIISVVFVGMGYIFARAVDYGSRLTSQAVDLSLARDLLEEIKTKKWEESGGVFGPDPGETGRQNFDDIDDYDGLSESPPETVEGIPMDGQAHGGKTYPDYSYYTRSVTVEYVPADNFTYEPGSHPGTATDFKRVAVDVSLGAKTDRLITVIAKGAAEEE